MEIKNSQETPLLQFSTNSYTISPVLKGSIISGVLANSMGGIVISSIFLSAVFKDFTSKCAYVLNTYSPELIHCRAPFQNKMALYESLLIVSTCALGYLCQKTWEFTPRERRLVTNEEISAPMERKTKRAKAFQLAKRGIATLQAGYGYEISLGLGYLFNGLWMVPKDQKSWFVYYSCQAASIGLAGALLGMYIRIQQHNLKKAYAYKNENAVFKGCKKHWKLIATSCLATACFAATFTFPKSVSREVIDTLQGVSLMLAARPLGFFVSSWIESLKKEKPASLKEKTISAISASLFLQSPLVILGYFIYLKGSGNNFSYYSSVSQLIGSALIGIAGGIKDNRFHFFDYRENKLEDIEPEERSTLKKAAQFCKEYWMTAALIGALITTFIPQILTCESIKMYVCPISFELSGNYVNLDGRGLGVTIASGLTAFYARKFFKCMLNVDKEPVKKLGEYVLNTMDKYQFDLLSIIPYAIFRSGSYISAYSAYASYDPLAVLILLGMTLGVYKEQVKSRSGAQVLPGFVNLGIMDAPL